MFTIGGHSIQEHLHIFVYTSDQPTLKKWRNSTTIRSPKESSCTIQNLVILASQNTVCYISSGLWESMERITDNTHEGSKISIAYSPKSSSGTKISTESSNVSV